MKYTRLTATINSRHPPTPHADGEFETSGIEHMWLHMRTAWTEQSLVPVTYVKDKNKDQYLKGAKALMAMVSRGNTG